MSALPIAETGIVRAMRVIEAIERSLRQTHELKVHAQFWDALRDGLKPFECRLDDRGFRVGDRCRLSLYDPKYGYVGPSVDRIITYILRHEDFPNGVPIGYAILAFGQFDDGK